MSACWIFVCWSPEKFILWRTEQKELIVIVTPNFSVWSATTELWEPYKSSCILTVFVSFMLHIMNRHCQHLHPSNFHLIDIMHNFVWKCIHVVIFKYNVGERFVIVHCAYKDCGEWLMYKITFIKSPVECRTDHTHWQHTEQKFLIS